MPVIQNDNRFRFIECYNIFDSKANFSIFSKMFVDETSLWKEAY